jgi:hypothetical protein
MSPEAREHSFDDLARALAEGSISRRRALKLFAGTAIAALIPSRALAQQQKVTICHKPGTPDEETKEVPQSAVDSHLRHGDLLGPCESTTTTSTSTSTSSTTSTSTSTTSTSTTTPTPCRAVGGSCSVNTDCCGCATCQSGTCACPTGTVLLTSNGTCAIPCGAGGSCPSGLTCLGTNEGGFCSPRGGPVASCSGSNAQCPTGSVCSGVLCEPAC